MNPNRAIASFVWGLLAATTWSQAPTFVEPGDAAGDLAGTAVALVGDVDDDGAQDFAIGSPLNDVAASNAGMARVFSGRTHLSLHTWRGDAANQRFGSAIAGVGDVDADGHDDVIVGAPFGNYADVFSGATGIRLYRLTGVSGRFGAAVAGGGRVDADAVPDILVGAPNASPGGVLTVFSGATGLPIRSHADACLSRLGNAATFLGDLDGDGRDEYAVGRPLPVGGCGVPAVQAFDGASGTPLWTSSSPVAWFDQLGWSLASLADVDGDGVRDVLAGAPQDPGVGCGPCNGHGYVRLLSGATGNSLWQVAGTSIYAGLGFALAAVGDVDGDEHEDFATSQPSTEGCGGNTQAVQIRSGQTGAVLSEIPRPAVGDNFGFALASGDADDDGVRDLLVGTPCDDVNGADSGAVYAYASPVAVAARRLYIDFGDAASAFGVPPSTYGGPAAPGAWNGVAASPAIGLIDANGATTFASLTVSATPMLDACGHAATTGDDESLYDDRWAFDPPAITMTVAGLEPGTYRVHVHVLVATCLGMFSPLSVTIAGATPNTADATATGWSGAPVAGQHYTVQYATIGSGADLVMQVSAPPGFSSYTQVCGLQIVLLDPPQPMCLGDGSGAPCPCGNTGAPGKGCENSFLTGGARLRVTFGGLPSVAYDSIELSGSGMPPTASALYFQGTTAVAGGLGATFGDGLRCAGGAVVRLGTKTSSGGSSAYPGPGDPSVSVRGMIPAGGGSRVYQVWYRNSAAYCMPDLFNLSNGLVLVWGP